MWVTWHKGVDDGLWLGRERAGGIGSKQVLVGWKGVFGGENASWGLGRGLPTCFRGE